MGGGLLIIGLGLVRPTLFSIQGDVVFFLREGGDGDRLFSRVRWLVRGVVCWWLRVGEGVLG